MQECPTLMCFHHRQLGVVDVVQDLFNQLNLLVPSVAPYDPWLCCYRHKHHQFSEFRIPWSENSPLWYAPTMLSCAQSWRNRPIRCDGSSGAIHFIMQPLAVGLQSQTSPIFEFQNPEMTEFPTLICPHYSRPGPAGGVRHLFHVLNLPVPSISWLDYWLLRYSNKHHQFSEFRIAKWMNAPHWYALTTVNQALGGAYCTYLMHWFSPCYPFCHITHGCILTFRNIPNFRVFKTRNRSLSSIDMLLLQLTRHKGSCTRPIWCAESPRAMRLALRQGPVVLHAQTSPIFGFWNPAIRQFPPLIYFHHSQPGIMNLWLHQFDAGNLVVQSVLWSDCWW